MATEARSTQAQRWQETRRLLDQVLALPAGERASFLRTACDDHSLRQEVEALLERQERLGDFLEQPFFSLHDRSDDPDAGRRLGPYRLVRPLGRGGMGVVYLAERVDGELRQEVAVKVLKRGLDTEEVVRRFHLERQILASLTHPQVARLLDAGTTDDGRPFLVMEHVEGQAIDAWCDARRLATRRRVELFLQVCGAVAFAHRNLVVHRDLKPANILITGEGTVKLLDFGVAKLLAPDPRFPTLTAAPGATPLSLPYASPEQLSGGTITTAADVYALGVVLYELLTGRRPHRLDNLNPEQAARVLREETPSRPSTAVRRRAEVRHADGRTDELTPESVSRTRDGDLRRLVRRLRGDLDNVVLRALHPEPEDRFASVEELSEELRRHLDGLPVRSRPQTFLYRSGKFVRRHAVGVATAVLIALLVVGFGLSMAVQRQQIAQERDRAEAVTDFLVDFIQAPNRAKGESLTVREALASGVERIDRELADQPDIRAALLDAAGGVYRNLALHAEARPLLEEALEVRRRLYGEGHVLVAESLLNLANLEVDEGDREKAETLMRRALAIQRRAYPRGHRDLAAGLNNLALLLCAKAEFEEAEALARESLAMKERLFGPVDVEVTKPLNTLATLLRRRGALEEAEALYRRSLALRRRFEDPASPSLPTALNALAGVLIERGDPEAAGPFYEEALRIRRALYSADHSELVTSLSNLGRQRILVGQPESATVELQEALAMARRLAANRPSVPVAFVARNLAWARLETGDYASCEELARSTLEVVGPKERRQKAAAETRSLLGGCLVGLERYAEAEPLLIAGYQGLVATAGEDALLTRLARERLAWGYDAWGRPDEAVRYRRR